RKPRGRGGGGRRGAARLMPGSELAAPSRSHGLVDVLDRVLDKGLVIAGDIKINLANVELLTVQVRLLVCSIDKAEQIGLNWWRSDPRLTMSPAGAGALGSGATADLEERLARIEQQLAQLVGGSGTLPASTVPSGHHPRASSKSSGAASRTGPSSSD